MKENDLPPEDPWLKALKQAATRKGTVEDETDRSARPDVPVDPEEFQQALARVYADHREATLDWHLTKLAEQGPDLFDLETERLFVDDQAIYELRKQLATNARGAEALEIQRSTKNAAWFAVVVSLLAIVVSIWSALAP